MYAGLGAMWGCGSKVASLERWLSMIKTTHSRAFRIDANCIEAHKYHYLYLLCKEGNYTEVSFEIGTLISLDCLLINRHNKHSIIFCKQSTYQNQRALGNTMKFRKLSLEWYEHTSDWMINERKNLIFSADEILKSFIKVRCCSNAHWKSMLPMRSTWSKVAIKLWCPANSTRPSNSTKLPRKHKQTTCLLSMVCDFREVQNPFRGCSRYRALSNTGRKVQWCQAADRISERSSNGKCCGKCSEQSRDRFRRIVVLFIGTRSSESTACQKWKCLTAGSNRSIVWYSRWTTF